MSIVLRIAVTAATMLPSISTAQDLPSAEVESCISLAVPDVELTEPSIFAGSKIITETYCSFSIEIYAATIADSPGGRSNNISIEEAISKAETFARDSSRKQLIERRIQRSMEQQ